MGKRLLVGALLGAAILTIEYLVESDILQISLWIPVFLVGPFAWFGILGSSIISRIMVFLYFLFLPPLSTKVSSKYYPHATATLVLLHAISAFLMIRYFNFKLPDFNISTFAK